MKHLFSLLLLVTILCSCAFQLADFPEAEISNGLVKAKLLLPDAQTGYYQSTRFDWSGVIESLEYKGHSYFGQWFKKYDPKINDAIMGPVESFDPIEFDEAAVNGNFLKVGVGILRKPDEKSYSAFRYYDIVNPGKWKVETDKDKVSFSQDLTDESGYAYRYTKTVRLTKGKPELVLEHSLKNTGKKTIEANVFNHNFFMIDKEPTGPGIKIKFPYNISGTGRGLDTLATINGKEINYIKEVTPGTYVYIGDLTGYRKDAKDYDIRIENQKTGGAVRITSDQPFEKLVYWSSSTTYCPEPIFILKPIRGRNLPGKLFMNFTRFRNKLSKLACYYFALANQPNILSY